MRKILFLTLILPLFIACSSDDNNSEFDLTGSKWIYEANFNSQYYWLELLEFKSNSDCVWSVVTKNYGPGYGSDYYELNDPSDDDLTYTEYHLTYSIKESEINFSDNGISKVKALIDLDSNTIMIGDKIFNKQ